MPSEGRARSRRVAIGAIASSGVNILKTALQLLLLPIMARLLGPEQFGLYALALPTVSLLALISDGGIGATLAREQESSSLVWSSAFWTLLAMGVSLGVASALFGILLGYLVGQPSLPGMIALLSLSLVFLALSVAPSARLTRRANLGTSAAVDLAATLFGAAVAIILALRGAGAWSLAAQYVTTYAGRAILLNMAAFHMPELEFSFVAIRPHLISGSFLIGGRGVEYAGRVAENFIINRIFGTAALGSFTFANQISKYSTEALGNVTWLSLYVQALTVDKAKVIALYHQLCRLLGATLFPLTFLAAAAAPDLIRLTLGPKWVDLSFMLQILLPLYALSTVCAQAGAILMAHNRNDLNFLCTAVSSLGRVVAVLLGFWTGLAGIFYGLVVVTLLYCFIILVASTKIIGSPLLMLKGLRGPAVSSVLATASYLLLMSRLPMNTIGLFSSLAAGLFVYVLCMVVLDRKNLIEDWAALSRIISRA